MMMATFTVQSFGLILALLCINYSEGISSLNCTDEADLECYDSSACFTHVQYCDGIPDCLDESDEPHTCTPKGAVNETDHISTEHPEDHGKEPHHPEKDHSDGGHQEHSVHHDDHSSDHHDTFKEGDTWKLMAPVAITAAWFIFAFPAHCYLLIKRPKEPEKSEDDGIAKMMWTARSSTKRESHEDSESFDNHSGSSEKPPSYSQAVET